MGWNKKTIDKTAEKENKVLSTDLLGTVRRFKSVTRVKRILVNMFGPIDCRTRKLAQDALLDAEHRKSKALALIRQISFI